MSVYITKFNAKGIIQDIEFNSVNLEDEIFLIDFKWFNSYQVKQLLAWKLLFSNPEEFFRVYNKKEKPIDTKSWVYESISPAYHSDLNCERLNSDYLNIQIPEEIKLQGDARVQEFRNWVKEHINSIDNEIEFNERIKLRFNLSTNPLVDFKKNGGAEFHSNTDLNNLESTLIELINRAYQFYAENDDNRLILDHFGKNAERQLKYRDMVIFPPPKFGWAKMEEVLTRFVNEFKKPITYYLQEYYRVKYNPDLKFEGSVLEQLGFRACKRCTDNSFYIEKYPIVYTEKYIDEDDVLIQALNLDKIISRNPFQDIYSEIIPIKIEQSLELPSRNKLTLCQLYITKNIESISEVKSLFSETTNSENDVVYFEKRQCEMYVPENVNAFSPVFNMLNKYPSARIYRIISKKPILSDSEELMLENEQRSLQQFINSHKRIEYKSELCLVKYFFSKMSKSDICRI